MKSLDADKKNNGSKASFPAPAKDAEPVEKIGKMMGIDSDGMLISAVHEEDGHEGLNLLMVDDRIPAGVKVY